MIWRREMRGEGECDSDIIDNSFLCPDHDLTKNVNFPELYIIFAASREKIKRGCDGTLK